LTFLDFRCIILQIIEGEETMLKALKITMIVYGLLGLLIGLSMLVIPDQMQNWYDLPAAPDYIKYFLGVLGALFVVIGIFYVVVSRDLITNILWVKFAIAEGATGALVALYSLLRDYGTFSQMGISLITHVVFTILLLAFYPWKKRNS
jgi:hypothetical protein